MRTVRERAVIVYAAIILSLLAMLPGYDRWDRQQRAR